MRRVFVVLLTILAIGATDALAQDKVGTTAAPFLTFPSSARQWGLGGAGAAIIDPFVAHFNPGGLGVYALTNPVGFARNSQDWAPSFIEKPDEMVYANTLVLAGFPISGRGGSRWPRLSVAAAFHRQSFRSHVEFSIYDNTVVSHWLERSDAYTLAVGIEKGIEVGGGGAMKEVLESSWLEEDDGPFNEQEESATGWDYGIFVRIPFQQVLTEWRLLERPFQFGPFTPEVTITTSYAWANRKGEIGDRPLPRLARFGRTIEVRLDYRDLPVIGWLATRDDEISKLDRPERRHEGWEVDFLGVVRFQKGDEPGSDGFESHGMSIHSAGVMRWIAGFDGDPSHSGLPWWITNLDIFYRFAEIEDTSDPMLQGTEFHEFGFTLNTGPLWE